MVQKDRWYLSRTDSEPATVNSSMHAVAADDGRARGSDYHMHYAGSAQDWVTDPASSLPLMAATEAMSLDQAALNLLCRWIERPTTAGRMHSVFRHNVDGKDVELVAAGDDPTIAEGTAAPNRVTRAAQGLYSIDKGTAVT